MKAGVIAVAVLALSAGSASAQSIWSVKGAPGTASFALIAAISPPVTYVFDCSERSHVIVTHTGATKLQDARKRKPVPDNASGPLPAGAAFMALRLDKGVDPQIMNEAAAAKNANGGWDLTIDLSPDDPDFVGMPAAKKIALVTTGKSTAVELTDEDRAVIANFIKSCTAAN